MDKGGPVFRIIRDLQKLRRLFILRIGERERNIEVAQAQLLRLCFLFGCAMLAGLPQIDDRFDAFSFQFFEMLEPWLAAGAEVFMTRRKFLMGAESSCAMAAEMASSRIEETNKVVFILVESLYRIYRISLTPFVRSDKHSHDD